MPNQLSIPFKNTNTLPIRQAVREYISTHHTDTHPDVFKWDVTRWESLRKDATNGVVHVDSVKASLSYHAQLFYILTKLPNDIGLEIPYTPAFNPTGPPLTLQNLSYELVSVLFNLAALYSQLAAAEDRSTTQGLKQAIAHSQAAAGVLKYLISEAAPKFRASMPQNEVPLEFSEPFLASLEAIMLAQAQEGVWQRAVMDNYKNNVIAKLAAQVSSYYAVALTHARDESSAVRKVFPQGWLAHMEVKQLHFEAAAQWRKSVDDLEANRYGNEVARLTQAKALAKRGHELAKQSRVAPAVFGDIKSLLDNVEKNFTRAERDNDFIYHHDVPAITSLPAIVEVSMVQATVPGGLTDPKAALGDDAIIFSELVGHGARMAIDIFRDRRRNWIQEEVIDRAQRLDDAATATLRSLNLPGALEALEKPVGLPPSLLKKAGEVRQEEGPARIESSIENVRNLAQRNTDLLNEALNFLDQEAEEDEVFQEEARGKRMSSLDANKELTDKAQRYGAILQQANESDGVVRLKWDEWEVHITELTWSDADLEAAVPSSTVSFSTRTPGGASSTQGHARQLRVLLEALDETQRVRSQIVAKAKRMMETDDITPQILQTAAAFERWKPVEASMFEDVIDEAMTKYEVFREDLETNEQKQETQLESIGKRNELFLQSRKEDPSVKEREHALQSLDLAYHKYREITRNLDEGLQFYNDFTTILTQFRETCRDWTSRRRNEMHSLIQQMQVMELDGANSTPHAPPMTSPAPAATPQPAASRPSPAATTGLSAFSLPPPDSEQWESMSIPPPAPPSKRSTATPRRVKK